MQCLRHSFLCVLVVWIAGVGAMSQDTNTLRYAIPQEQPNGLTPKAKGLQGADPSVVRTAVQYDPATNQYYINRSVGGLMTGGQILNFDEYSKYNLHQSTSDYWRTRSAGQSGNGSKDLLSTLFPSFKISQEDIMEKLLAGTMESLKINLSAEILLGFTYDRRDDPSLDISRQRMPGFLFDAKFDVSMDVKIADKFNVKLNNSTEALFAFDNQFKLAYEGKEDEIIKFLQVGNIDFGLKTTLIQGSQNLFGFKTKLQFGNTFVTGVFSEQRSESKTMLVEGGAQSTPINFKADNYEDNRHFFIAHYFRENYNKALQKLPIINTNINILKIEVWVTTIGAPVTNNRNIVAFTDLAEHTPNNPLLSVYEHYPSNNTNNLLSAIDLSVVRDINRVGNYLTGQGFVIGTDFEKIESARRLQSAEYTFNHRLGFISLNSRLNADQVLAVAFQYQIIGDSTIYQVGEFSDQGINEPNALMVKLLKSTTLNTKSSLWSLMMKNVYSLNAYQVSKEDFRLNIVYAGDDQGVMTGYFKEGPKNGIPLLSLFGMDNLDMQENRVSDGMFDFMDNAATQGGLIQASTGRLFLPYTEPFGRDLITIFDGDSVAAEPYMFKELYENTKVEAQNYPRKNKYYFDGSFRSSSSNEISLGSMNVPQGSVKVMAGNLPLVENVDYTVDYMLGRVRIINDGILNSGTPISVSCENNAMFNIMTKRMIGLRVDHIFSDRLTVGGTFMSLRQTPLTQKVNIGEEPISNSIYGFDVAYNDESRWLTKAVDKILPFTNSKTLSNISFYGEFAHFIPGYAKAIGNDIESSVVYIDDFEGSKSSFSLKDIHTWNLASIPRYQGVNVNGNSYS